MVTISQRIYELRSQKNLSKADLSAALHLAPKAIDRFESGRQTPSKDQQQSLANFFEVSLAYLRGETNDPTRQDSWMDMTYEAEKEATPRPAAPKPIANAAAQSLDMPLMDALLKNPAVRSELKKMILETLQSTEGQKMIRSILQSKSL